MYTLPCSVRFPRSVLMLMAGFLLGGTVSACGEIETGSDSIQEVSGSSRTTHHAPRTTLPSTTTETTTKLITTTTIPHKGWLVVQGTGDVNLDPSYIPALANRGFAWAWSGVDRLFLDDDLTLVNLECSPSPLGLAEDKDFTFRCPDGLTEMAAAGVEVANLGNNHSQDFGKEAMLDGVRNLSTVGIAPVGVGRTSSIASIPALFDINGWRLAIVGFGGVRPHDAWVASDDRAGMADGDTIETMVAAVKAASSVADFVLVTIHWGVELDTTPRSEDVDRAEAMIAAGADAIFGHHPHRLQPLETVAGRPVFWSLGNFVWPEMSLASATTGVARVVITPDGEVSGCLIPALIESSGHPVLVGEPPCGAQ